MKPAWKPNYTMTNKIINKLMRLESLRSITSGIPIASKISAKLKHEARLKSVHFSTRIEGNRLSLKQAKGVIDEDKRNLYGRERDVKEVQNYWNALIETERLANARTEFDEKLVKKIHSIVETGSKTKPTPYRKEQNIIKDSSAGRIVYMPPEAKDVPGLMKKFTFWVRIAEKEKLPVPVIAALTHYQFVTIHPYYDGNGRTARLLSTFILMKGNYGMDGMFSLEEYHAKNIEAYYRELTTHEHHNYYEGRENADLTKWIIYFLGVIEEAFVEFMDLANSYSSLTSGKNVQLLKTLDRRAREIYPLFELSETIKTGDIARVLKIKNRMAAYLAQKWVKKGFLVSVGNSNKTRAYKLSSKYR